MRVAGHRGARGPGRWGAGGGAGAALPRRTRSDMAVHTGHTESLRDGERRRHVTSECKNTVGLVHIGCVSHSKTDRDGHIQCESDTREVDTERRTDSLRPRR